MPASRDSFLGGLTRILDSMYPGVGLQAVIGTLSVFGVTLVLFKSGKVRATPKHDVLHDRHYRLRGLLR